MLVILCLIWGVTWPLMKIALNQIPPFSMRTVTAALGAATLYGFCRATGRSLYIPNVKTALHIVIASLEMAVAILVEAALSFLGLGIRPPTPSWGLMIGAARATMTQAPLLLLWPCLALTLTILSMNAFCDALRDAFDPRRLPE